MKHNWIVYILTVPMYLVFGIMMYWLLWSIITTPFVVNDYYIDSNKITHEFKPLSARFASDGSLEVSPGDTLMLVTDSKRKHKCIMQSNRIMENVNIDYASYRINFYTRTIEPAKHAVLYSAITVPYNITPGKYYLFSQFQFICNPINYLFPITMETPKILLTVREFSKTDIENDALIKELKDGSASSDRSVSNYETIEK